MNIVKAIKAYRNAKASVYAFIGLAISAVINLTPFYIAYNLIFEQDRILLGIFFPIIFWLVVGFYMALLPFVWIYGIFAYGFWESTLSCVALFGIFYLPDFFFALAERQARKAEEAEQHAQYYEEPPNLAPLDIAIEYPKGSVKTVIARGTPIPHKATLQLKVTSSGKNLSLNILQGIGSSLAGFRPLAYSDISAPRNGELPVFVTLAFELHSNGNLDVSARSDTNKRLIATTSELSILSELEVKQLVDEFGNQKKKVLLIASRTEPIELIFQEVFHRESFLVDVLECYNQQDFDQILQTLANTRYDLVVPTNLGLSPLYIPQLVSEIKRRNTTAKIIAISGYASLEVALDLAKRGIDDFVPLPFESTKVSERINELLSLWTSDRTPPNTHNGTHFANRK
jgi:ActR/RegA family two-component response regulator